MLRITALLAAIILGLSALPGWSQGADAHATGADGDSVTRIARAEYPAPAVSGAPISGAPTPKVDPGSNIIDSSLLRDGDIVLRRGRGFLSLLFSAVGPGDHEFSHGGIFLRQDGRELIIHTVASEITGKGAPRIEPLESFIGPRRARSAAVYRVKVLDPAMRARFLETALGYVRDKVPFDDDFDLADKSKLYCTELIYQALLEAGVALVDHPHKLMAPVGGLQIAEIITAGQIAMSAQTEFIVRLK